MHEEAQKAKTQAREAVVLLEQARTMLYEDNATASVEIVEPGTIVRKHETYSEHFRQKVVRAAEPRVS